MVQVGSSLLFFETVHILTLFLWSRKALLNSRQGVFRGCLMIFDILTLIESAAEQLGQKRIQNYDCIC